MFVFSTKMKLILILYLIAIKTIESKIVINVFADSKNPTISFNGTGIQEATPRDMWQLFFIDKSTMKNYISTYYNNTIPRKVLYSSSTLKSYNATLSSNGLTSGDVHKRFNFNPTVLVSSVKFAQTKYVHEGLSLQLNRTFKNPTNETKKVNAGIEMPVAITLETVWYETPYIERGFKSHHDFVYDINVSFNENSGTTGITHTKSLGKPSKVHELVNIGQRYCEVELKPGQSVIAKFSAKVCNLAMKATVVTSVTGNLAVNFKEALNGRHWWGPKIEDVLRKVNLPSESPIEENLIIRLDYYYDVKVEIFDKETGLLL